MPEPVAGPRFRPPVVAAALALGAMLVAGGIAVAAGQSVTVASFAFTPATVTVNVGDTVTWTNTDPIVHTATATDGSWDTGDIAEGASASITFSSPGTFAYVCTPHPTMTGTVVVQAPVGGGGGGGGGSRPTTPPTDVAGLSGQAIAPDARPAVVGLLGAGLLIGGAMMIRRRGSGAA